MVEMSQILKLRVRILHLFGGYNENALLEAYCGCPPDPPGHTGVAVVQQREKSTPNICKLCQLFFIFLFWIKFLHKYVTYHLFSYL